VKLSEEQKNIIEAPLGALAVTACAGSGKTETAIRRLIVVRHMMKDDRGRVVLLSFSNVAVNTFNKGFKELASALPSDVNRKRVEVDTLDGFFTKHVLRPHAYRTMGANQAAYLVSGTEPFLAGFRYWPEEGHPLPVKELKVGIKDGAIIFFTHIRNVVTILDAKKATETVNRLGRTGAYTHELGRYWVYRTLMDQPAVLRALAARYPQIIVDESQDLGTLHQKIVELLIGADAQVSLIGDVSQGIYGFAGADGTFLNNYTTRAEVASFKLTRNYRSLPSITNIANLLSCREDKPDRAQDPGGAFFIGYKEAEIPKLFESFKATLDDLGIPHQDAVILSRGAERAATLSGKSAPPGQGVVAIFAQGALLRDKHSNPLECFRHVCRAVVGLLESPPAGLVSKLQGAHHETWMLGLRRLLWSFSRNPETGLPSSALAANTVWHPQLLKNVRTLLAEIEKQFGYKAVEKLGNKLAKTSLTDLPLMGDVEAKKDGPGIRVETVHQVKGESIDAVLFVATKANITALLSGTVDEEGRIGYVAVTRARNLFWLAVPHTNLKEFREGLLGAGFTELNDTAGIKRT